MRTSTRFASYMAVLMTLGLLSGCSWIPFWHSGPDWKSLDGTAQINNSSTVKKGDLSLELIDTSANNATIAVTQQNITGVWPLHFELMYDARSIHESHRYVLMSRIHEGDNETYVSTDPVPVITLGAQQGNVQLTLKSTTPEPKGASLPMNRIPSLAPSHQK